MNAVNLKTEICTHLRCNEDFWEDVVAHSLTNAQLHSSHVKIPSFVLWTHKNVYATSVDSDNNVSIVSFPRNPESIYIVNNLENS